MASTAYYVKRDENDDFVTYRYGSEPAELSSTMTIQKAVARPLQGDGREMGLTARMALARIIKIHHDGGAWPDRGSSFV